MSEYNFTQDWFHWAPEVWKHLVPMLPGRKDFLEIGSFEGRSTVWIVENMMEDGGHIDCIDTWEGGEEHGEEDMGEVEVRFVENMEKATHGIPKDYEQWKGTSTEMLGYMVHNCHTYDFIYIDGSHIARDVLTDACMAWPLLKPKGIMVFDDYMWGEPRDILHRPKPAVDCFTNLFAEELNIVHVGYQLVVQKKG